MLLSTLPTELAWQVLSYLTWTERVWLAQTCKTLYRLVSGYPSPHMQGVITDWTTTCSIDTIVAYPGSTTPPKQLVSTVTTLRLPSPVEPPEFSDLTFRIQVLEIGLPISIAKILPLQQLRDVKLGLCMPHEEREDPSPEMNNLNILLGQMSKQQPWPLTNRPVPPTYDDKIQPNEDGDFVLTEQGGIITAVTVEGTTYSDIFYVDVMFGSGGAFCYVFDAAPTTSEKVSIDAWGGHITGATLKVQGLQDIAVTVHREYGPMSRVAFDTTCCHGCFSQQDYSGPVVFQKALKTKLIFTCFIAKRGRHPRFSTYIGMAAALCFEFGGIVARTSSTNNTVEFTMTDAHVDDNPMCVLSDPNHPDIDDVVDSCIRTTEPCTLVYDSTSKYPSVRFSNQ